MRARHLFATFIAALALPAVALAAGTADTVYYNGNIITMSPNGTMVEAVAVSGSTIVGTGNFSNMKALAKDGAKMVDLQRKTMLPGFIDAHSHFIDNAVRTLWVNVNSKPLGTVEKMDDIVALLKERAAKTPEGEWVIGWGYDDTNIKEMRHPTRADLDKVSTKHPVIIQHISGWVTASNSVALAKAKVDKGTSIENGVIRKEANGTPNGVIESATCPVMSLVPKATDADYVKSIRTGSDMYLAKGCTTAQEGWMDPPRWFDYARDALKSGDLKLRLVMYPMGQGDAYDKLGKHYPNLVSGQYLDDNHMLTMGASKLTADGSIQAYTGFLSQPYTIQPEGKTGYVGYPSNDPEWLKTRVLELHKAGKQVAIHCNGDAAVESGLNAFEYAQKAFPREDARFVVVHSQMARQDQVERMARLKAIPSFFITHTYFWGDRHYERFMGTERAVRMSPAGDALRNGLPFTLHNDTYVTPIDPLLLVWSAVNRQSFSGRDLGKDLQAVPVMDALKGITINAAYQGFEEKLKGSIEIGKLADFVVLDNNPLTVDPMQIKDIKVLTTIVGNKVAYGVL